MPHLTSACSQCPYAHPNHWHPHHPSPREVSLTSFAPSLCRPMTAPLTSTRIPRYWSSLLTTASSKLPHPSHRSVSHSPILYAFSQLTSASCQAPPPFPRLTPATPRHQRPPHHMPHARRTSLECQCSPIKRWSRFCVGPSGIASVTRGCPTAARPAQLLTQTTRVCDQ